MLSKFLLVGVGGSGGKTLRALKNNLELRLTQAGWDSGMPAAWQFLHIDSPVIQDGTGFPAPMLPATDYMGLSRAGQKYTDAYQRMMTFVDGQDKEDFKEFVPSDQTVDVDITAGAGQFRGVGRVLILSAHDQVKAALREKMNKMSSGAADAELRNLARKLGVDDQIQPSPTIIVISSIAGGSGAGQFLEISEMIKGLEPSQNWVHEIFNMLYAPDVFTEVDPELLAGNALFAMAEVMSGIWSKPAAGTIRMTDRMGAAIPYGDPNYKTGAKYNFMVGKGGFETQEDVYLAVASSLTTWITDQEVNDRITAFSRGNYANSSLESNLPDRSGLKEPNKDATPFMALGFGRVGLGKERFVAYSAERLARSAIDRMLFAHTLDDPRFAIKTEDEWITFYSEKNLFDFIDEVGLNEETEEHNDVIDAIRPTRDSLFSEFKNEVLGLASQGLGAKTNAQSLIEWDDNLRNGFNVRIESYLGLESLARNEKMRPWVKQKKVDVLATTSRYASQQGIKVTVEILRRLGDKLIGVADELRAEAEVSLKYAADLSSYIRGELGQVPDKNQNEIRADHPAVDAALERVVDSFSYRAEASLKQTVATLLADMSENFIEPLRDDLLAVHKGLLTNKEEFAAWSTEDSVSVPKRFSPSKNEKLLIETKEYPAEFADLVNNSVTSEKRANSMRVVIDEVIMGGLAIEDLDRRNYWTLVSTSRDWVPTIREAREDSQQTAQAARFDISLNPYEYLERAYKWMKRMGTPFVNYINENLATYLTKAPDRSILQDRHNKFLAKLGEAIDDGAPLITINQGLLSKIHDSKPTASVVVSTFPLDQTHAIYGKVEELLIQKGLKDAVGGKTFDAQSPAQSIDFFSVHQGVQPMVLDSIIQPISKYWNEHSSRPATRQSLLQYRRPRYLYESIPASEKPKQDILKGFFVAKTLKQFQTDKNLSDEVLTDKGPKLSVWSGEGSKWFDFPHPLLSPDVIKTTDFPGALLYSITLGIVACNASQSLDPLAAYSRLQNLAHIDSPSSPMKKWILTGTLKDGPTPDAKRAGSVSDSAEARKTTIAAYIADLVAKYEARFAKQSLASENENAIPRDLTWEIREALMRALHSLHKEILALDTTSDEDDD
jgi:hypothetical protein